MKIATVFGTRPEIIKMSRLIPLLDQKFDHVFIFSGQHYSENMVDIFFDELGVRRPDYHLDVKSSELAVLMPPLIAKLREVNPDYVIVYGDTNSTVCAAVAAKVLNKKLIHVEAGLRSFDKRMHEEYNRILTDHISDFLFTPTSYTEKLLANEGLTKNVFVVGNTIVDAVKTYLPKADKSDILDKFGLKGEGYILLTLHRQELVENQENLKTVIGALASVKGKIIFPIHPHTKKKLSEFGIRIPNNIITIDPVGYLEMLKLLKEAALVITDSGGLQEEAVTVKTPCVSLLHFSERMETVELGVNFLVGYDGNKMKSCINTILSENLKQKMKNMPNPYGDGNASQRIVDILSSQTG